MSVIILTIGPVPRVPVSCYDSDSDTGWTVSEATADIWSSIVVIFQTICSNVCKVTCQNVKRAYGIQQATRRIQGQKSSEVKEWVKKKKATEIRGWLML